ncbi:Poly [ADP-ribose] polymerase 2 [Dissophora globulifera]|nr:Poly [ADP-ribose] polymerase 2 [Dissophora globulifera]
MPPKRAAKTATPPPPPVFTDCVFCIAGTLPLKQKEIGTLLEKDHMNGTLSSAFTKKVTHLITTENDIKKPTIKVTQAQASGTVALVKLDWILDSEAAKKRLDITPYLLVPVPSSSAATTTVADSNDTSTTNHTASKRKVQDDADDEIEDKVQKKIKTLTDKVAKSANSPVKIRQPPIDRACTLGSHYSVYVDDTIAWNARLNQTEIGHNNNKFYLIQLLASSSSLSYAVFSHWGRVGTNGQKATDMYGDLSSAKAGFERKFRDKTKNGWSDRDNFIKHPGKYHLLPPDDGDSDDEDAEDADKAASAKGKKVKEETEEEKPAVPESKLHPKVQGLMELIFNTGMMNRQMKELDYDADKMPLGKLAKATILQGYETLKKISVALDKPTVNISELSDLSSEFYTVIPHNFGRHVPPIIRDAPTLKKKLEMLEALGEIEIAQRLMKENKKADEALTMNPLDQQFSSLKLNKLEPMDKNSDRFKLIEQFVRNSHGATHSAYQLVIDEVFDLDRQGEAKRFDDAGFNKLHNRRLLWHGSRLTNYVGILSQGLRIAPPEAPVTGYMFDKGAYFADCVSKSANYCFTDRHNDTGLMLLCEVALGDMFEIEQSDYRAKINSEKAGKHSTKGLGLSYPQPAQDVIIDDNLCVQAGPLTTEKQKGSYAFRLQYNEYIVYNTSQIKMRYLIRMKFDYGKRR